MTEPDYLTTEDPDALFAAVGGRLSRRKLILFACGCLRLVPFQATGRRTRHAIDVIEKFADGLVPIKAIEDVALVLREDQTSPRLPTGRHADHTVIVVYHLAAALCSEAGDPAVPARTAPLIARMVVPDRGPAAQARVFREIAGNPFRPVAFDPAWRTSAVVGLAEAVQADRGFDRLPILADALEDAGCDAAELLAHFRGPGVHARGCWALDLVLGKA